MKKLLALLMLALPVMAQARPRFPFPKTPDEIWQNDLDLAKDAQNALNPLNIASGTIAQFNASTISFSGGIIGQTNGVVPPSTNIGAIISSMTLATIASPGTSQLFDIVSMPLPAGNWLLMGSVSGTDGTATFTSTSFLDGGISFTAGNSATGLTYGDTRIQVPMLPTATTTADNSVPTVLLSTTAPTATTVYLKCAMSYSAGTPRGYGKIIALRR